MADGAPTERGFNLRRFLLSGSGWPYLLVPFIPIAIALEFGARERRRVIFGAAALGVIPTAALMGSATEELAARTGPGIGGLLNVTFGNFPELVIAFFALREGLQEVVKASMIGSILGNILLVMGARDVRRRRSTATKPDVRAHRAPRRRRRCCCSPSSRSSCRRSSSSSHGGSPAARRARRS